MALTAEAALFWRVDAVLSDGFGDQQPPEDQFLAEIEGWLRYTVGKYAAGDPRFEDAVQEGRIELWRAYRQLEGDPNRRQYTLHRAKLRIKHYLFRGEPQTGHTRMLGRPEVKPVTSLDRPVGDDSTATLADLLAGVDALAGVEMAYHHGEIMEALSALPAHHREYVVRRFWAGDSDTEIAKALGLSSSKVLYNRWSRTIRPTLEAALTHMAAV